MVFAQEQEEMDTYEIGKNVDSNIKSFSKWQCLRTCLFRSLVIRVDNPDNYSKVYLWLSKFYIRSANTVCRCFNVQYGDVCFIKTMNEFNVVYSNYFWYLDLFQLQMKIC